MMGGGGDGQADEMAWSKQRVSRLDAIQKERQHYQRWRVLGATRLYPSTCGLKGALAEHADTGATGTPTL